MYVQRFGIWPSVWYQLVHYVVWCGRSYRTFRTAAACDAGLWCECSTTTSEVTISCAPPLPPACWGQRCALRQKGGTPNDKGSKVIENRLPSVLPQNLVRLRVWTELLFKYEPTFSLPHGDKVALVGRVALRGPCERPLVLPLAERRLTRVRRGQRQKVRQRILSYCFKASIFNV